MDLSDKISEKIQYEIQLTRILERYNAGCAVTRGAQIGLDAEDSHRLTRTDPIKLARRRFSPLELVSLQRRDLIDFFIHRQYYRSLDPPSRSHTTDFDQHNSPSKVDD